MTSASDTESDQSHRLNVLLVEDNPGDARLVQKRLERSNYALLDADVKLYWADCLSEAITSLENTRFDAILLDLGLPESQGLATLERISPHSNDVPVIVLTGLDAPAVSVQAVRAGAQDYLHKDGLEGDQIARALRYALERKRAERKLHARITEMDRVITMGTLATGTAHEINNPMAFVTGNIEYALKLIDRCDHEHLPEQVASNLDEVSDALNDALDGSHRVRKVVRDLRKLAGGGSDLTGLTMEPISVEDTLESSINLARNHIVERARLVTDIDQLPQVMGSESRLGQVFLNILLNAAQAIPLGDTAGNEVRVEGGTRGAQVVVTISDTGCGISDENLSEVFTPFFTTKNSDEGIGLGLAISRPIVTGLGGDIEVESTVGEGTTFRVVLPTSEGMFAQMTEVDER